jgi:adenylate kinase family enzyme
MASSVAHDVPMRRIMVVGNAGAGKSTFARRLGAKLALPVIHLDAYFWRPGWQASEAQAWRQQLATLAAAPAWVMDGNYVNTYDIRMPRADTLVWLDHPRGLCMRRVLMRTIKGYGRRRADLAPDCPERFDMEFFRYVWNFPTEYRPRLIAGMAQFGGHLRAIRLADDRDVESFLTTAGES